MNKNNTKKNWVRYKEAELKKLAPMLESIGFALEEEQAHISGERHLMSGFKLVLNGLKKDDGKKVIIKASSHKDGIKEIRHEHDSREAIRTIDFAYRDFLLPEEILFTEKNGFLISITLFINQKKSFLEHDLKEQFFLTLRALETQEGTHVTTRSHLNKINKIFGVMKSDDYLNSMDIFIKTCAEYNPDNIFLKKTLDNAFDFLKTNELILKKFSDFLTHSDFVPHNIRIINHDMYLLDHTSILFGNKHESWARFMNYMIIYNPNLEHALAQYVRQNREDEEYLSLRLMRVYKIVFLLNFYSGALDKTEGDLNKLTKIWIIFWAKCLEAILEDKQINEKIVLEYKKERDALRSDEEKLRQKKLKQLF